MKKSAAIQKRGRRILNKGKTELNKDIKRSLPYKMLIVCLIILGILVSICILLAILLTIIQVIEPIGKKQVLSEETDELKSIGIFETDPVTGIDFPDDCSEGELGSLWNSVFVQQDSSEIAKISNGDCSAYILYHIPSDDDVKIIWGKNIPQKKIIAVSASLIDTAKTFLTQIDETTVGNADTESFIIGIENCDYNVQGTRDIGDVDSAKNEFNLVFGIEIDDVIWFESGNFYLFEDKGIGKVHKTKIGDSFEAVLTSIDLTQTTDIPNLNTVEGYYYSGIIDLDDYFENLGAGEEIGLSYNVSQPKVQIIKKPDFDNEHEIDMNISNNSAGVYAANISLSYPGLASVTSNNFNITVAISGCTDSDNGEEYNTKGTSINASVNGTDSCHNGTERIPTGSKLQEFYCNGTNVENYIIPCSGNYYCNDGACVINSSLNRTPEFISENCSVNKIKWIKNNNFTFDLANCFRDPDGDFLTYRIESSNLYVRLVLSGSFITLIPNKDWYGLGNFYAYANDSLNEKSALIYFLVNNTGDNQNPNETDEILKIINPNPSSEIVTKTLGENLTFFIENTDYDSIEWRLDNEIITTDSNTCEISELSKGNHTLEVKIRKGVQEDSKIWKIIIEDAEKTRKFVFDAGIVMLILIIIVVFIIIILVIWLFINENKRKNKLKLDNNKPSLKKGDGDVVKLNIPK